MVKTMEKRIETTLERDGAVTLTDLPFHAGDVVEITIREKQHKGESDSMPLRGLPVHYDQPFEPVAADEWESEV